MRRAAGIIAVLAAAGAAWLSLAGAGGGDDRSPRYWVEVDNAFGLVTGGDLKIAGVRAGTITDLELDKRTRHARVGIKIKQDGFGSLRTDATCAVRPQSLIGEYFLDCQPGVASQRLKRGGTVRVERTTSTIAPDLVNDILRKPQAQRLSIILGELGAGVAGNGENLNAALRRANPALQQVDKVLALLARQSQVLANLTKNADTVVGDLAANRKDVGRWVDEAGNAASASAERRVALAAGLRRLPTFLAALRTNLSQLGDVADAQTPALRDLDRSAADAREFFDRLGPFSDASRPATRALGRAGKTGIEAVRTARPTIAQLSAFAKGVPELGGNLALVLEHLDDPSHAVEDDVRASRQTGRAMPTGYTGLEALLQYVQDQTTSSNVFDANSHLLTISAFPGGNCGDYADAERGKKYKDECAASLGPNGPGISSPDPTDPAQGGSVPRRARSAAHRSGRSTAAPAPTGLPGLGGLRAPAAAAPAESAAPRLNADGTPSEPGLVAAARPAKAPDGQTQTELLDFLLGA